MNRVFVVVVLVCSSAVLGYVATGAWRSQGPPIEQPQYPSLLVAQDHPAVDKGSALLPAERISAVIPVVTVATNTATPQEAQFQPNAIAPEPLKNAKRRVVPTTPEQRAEFVKQAWDSQTANLADLCYVEICSSERARLPASMPGASRAAAEQLITAICDLEFGYRLELAGAVRQQLLEQPDLSQKPAIPKGERGVAGTIVAGLESPVLWGDGPVTVAASYYVEFKKFERVAQAASQLAETRGRLTEILGGVSKLR